MGAGEATAPGLVVVHSLLLDECSRTLWAASRENNLVVGFDMGTLQEKARVELTQAEYSGGGRGGGGMEKVWALQRGPHGSVVALVYVGGKVRTCPQ